MASRVSRTRVGTRNAVPASVGGPGTPAAPGQPSADAAERKRLRDRVAQQNLRNKRNRHIQALEQQVRLCQELHRTAANGTAGQCIAGERSPDDIKTINDLKAENAALRERQKQLQALFASFKEVFEPASTVAAVSLTDIAIAPEAAAVAAASSGTTMSIAAGSPDEQTPKQSSPLPPPAPSSPQDASPVSSSSTAEVVMSSSVPYQPMHNTRTMADTLPDYSIWLAGISNGSASTDGDSETEMINPHHHQHHHNMDEMTMHSIHYQATTNAYLHDLTAGTPSLFDTHPSQMAGDPSGMWSVSRMGTPQYLKTAVSMMPMTALSALPAAPADFTAPYGPSILDHPSSTSLCTWHPAPPPPITSRDDASRAVDDIPMWARIPVRTVYGPNDVLRPAWDSNMRIIFDSPEMPSPLDLMYGSKHNPLADSLQRSCKRYYKGQVVRLAVGWTVYQYIKWRTQPTATRYALLPHYLKPIHEQIWMPHPGSLDLIVWEPLRRKMLRDYDKYDMALFIRQYTRCLQLRWEVDDTDILETDSVSGQHVLRPAFVEKMMNESGWGLKPEFRTYYPELFEDDEWERVVYDPKPKAIS
ncbi:hypothetical protein SBRCBS47491_005395 [Sporothrix bragantina]|uniref:BZIP domain-containing protein n=1 Tax=Sporothrix bragantina TaxID=671064 RepID=A0ABP0BWF8_9PEZI